MQPLEVSGAVRPLYGSLGVKGLISMGRGGEPFHTVINSAQFSHLNTSITPGDHQSRDAAPRASGRGVQTISSVY